LNELEEFGVDTRILGEFGMKGSSHNTSFPHQHRITVSLSKDFDSVADLLNARGANENHLQRLVAEFRVCFQDGGVDLTAVGVALDGHVEGIQAGLVWIRDVFRKQNGSGAGAERRLGVDEISQALKQVLRQQLQKCRGFAAGDNKAVDVVEVFGFADEYDVSAEFFEAAAMGVEIALEGEDTDGWNTFRHSLFAGSAVSFQLSAFSKTKHYLDYRGMSL
jgi:hypothetical protein